MKRLLFSAALTLSLAMAPNMGLAQSAPLLSVAAAPAASPFEPTGRIADFFEDLRDVQSAYFALTRAIRSGDPAAIAAARADLAAAVSDLFGNVGGVGSPAV
jgi:hypothetical protein